MTEDERKIVENFFLVPFENSKHCHDWIEYFLGLDLPMTKIDPESNSSPVEAIYETYCNYRDDKNFEIPGYIWLSSRDSYKTLSESVLAVILMCHFNIPIAHLAAIKAQSEKAISYVNSFLRRLTPVLEVFGRQVTSETKSKAQVSSPNGDIAYVNVIVCTMAGANCVDPNAFVKVKDKGEIKAQDIKNGDYVLTRNYKTGTDQFVPCLGATKTIKESRKIILKSGRSLVVSNDHPIFTNSGWIRASQIKIGHSVIANSNLSYYDNTNIKEYQVKRSLDQLILGTLLGDSSLQRLPSGSVRYSTSHCIKNSDYIYEIKKVFENNGVKCHICKDKNQLKLTTQTKEIFKTYYDLTVDKNTNKKTVNSEWLSRLNYEGVAYWVMDDGRGNPQKIGSQKEHCFSLATCGFTMRENDLIKKYFIKLGYNCNIKTITNQTKKKYPIVSFDLLSSRKLSQNISSFFVNSLRYKLLSTPEEASERWEMDTGNSVTVNKINHNTFIWNKNPNSKKTRQQSKLIKDQFNDLVEKIELFGKIDLIDISVSLPDKTLHSFYANGILVHNSEHVPFMTFDELDVIRFPQAYEESKLIPSRYRNKGPLTVKCSTRKFAFGVMEKELGEAKNTGEKILRWNIMDITERCPESKHLPDQPKVQRYIRPKKLPLVNLSPEEYTMVPDAQQKDFEPITAYAGCATCPLLSICQTRLAHRPKEETGGLYKPINFTIRQFKITSPDMAEAQLLCWKPSLSGLVYPRFEESSDVISVADAWKFYTGNDGNKNTDFKTLVDAMHYAGTPFNVGVDWGHAHAFAITVSAMVRGEWWFFDCYAQSGLEFEDMMKLLREVKRIYNPAKVAPDDSQPMFIKAARKDARLNCVKFTKDVAGGIELVRAKIVDGTGKRRLKIISHERTEFLINGFKKHHFKLDAAGIPTKDPDDEEYADVMDTVRYQAQILFEKESTIRTAPNDQPKQTVVSIQEKAHIEANKNWITDKVAELQVNNGGLVKNKSGSIIADFGDE